MSLLHLFPPYGGGRHEEPWKNLLCFVLFFVLIKTIIEIPFIFALLHSCCYEATCAAPFIEKGLQTANSRSLNLRISFAGLTTFSAETLWRACFVKQDVGSVTEVRMIWSLQ